MPASYSDVTIQVEVFTGGVWCYVSLSNRSPNSEDYNWKFYISEYNDLYVSRESSHQFLFVAINGTELTNNYTIIWTRGDTTVSCKHCLANSSPLLIL